jgi:ComF family protein
MKIGAGVKSLKTAVLDSLFPIFCLSCQKEGSWLCKDCLAQMKLLDFQVCPACEDSITDKGFLCFACRETRQSRLDGLIAAVSYEDPAARKMVHNFKYRFVSDISQPLAKLICRALIRNDIALPDFIVPVPLHSKRLRWRGFNQSLLLAKHVSKELAPLMEIKILDILQRKYYNRPQMNVKNHRERLENVKDIFGLRADTDEKNIKNKIILIIDDIATTGATLEECAKVLKSAGAKKVFAAVVARQSLKK